MNVDDDDDFVIEVRPDSYKPFGATPAYVQNQKELNEAVKTEGVAHIRKFFQSLPGLLSQDFLEQNSQGA